MKTIAALFFISLAMLAGACQYNATETFSDVLPQSAEEQAQVLAAMKTSLQSLAGTKWVLQDYSNDKLDPSLRNRATIEFLASDMENSLRIQGRSFINWYAGSAEFNDTRGLEMSGFMSTKVGGSKLEMDAESDFFRKLEKVNMFSYDGKTLKLFMLQTQETANYTRFVN